tara:strand:- start:659 stop:1951 length:1293 start_codon:yes stop_codon:yes gene_type:complete
MKTLNRPMFRYGGPIKEGVMNGIREPKQNGGTIAGGNQMGMPMGNRTGFADPVNPGYLSKLGTSLMNFYNPLKKGKVISKLGSKITKIPKYKYVDGGNMIKETPMLQRAIQFGKANPKLTGAGAAAGVTSGLAENVVGGGLKLAGKGILQVGDLLVSDKYFDQDKYLKEKFPDGLFGGKKESDLDKSKLTNEQKRIAELQALLDQKNKVDEVPTKSADELRQDRIQKYRDIMDIKGMNKNAAYDSLIAASQAVLGEGNFKGSIKDGSLIGKIIGSTSKAFDKPKATKDAIDTLILKGEIEGDIAAGKPSTYLKAAQDMVATGASKNIQEAMKTLTKSENSMSSTLGALLAKGNRIDEKLVGVAYREETGNIPAGSVKVSVVNEWKEDNKGKNEIDYLESISEGEQLDAGDYIIGERVITVDKSGGKTFFY